MLGVKFGDRHSYADFGLILSSKKIGSPELVKNLIDIPGRNGPLDLSEALTGYPVYSNRKLEFTFSKDCQTSVVWAKTMSDIMNGIHGKKMDIVLDDDPDFRYVGRVDVKEYTLKDQICTITVECDCEPFKYQINDEVVSFTGYPQTEWRRVANFSEPLQFEIDVPFVPAITRNLRAVINVYDCASQEEAVEPVYAASRVFRAGGGVFVAFKIPPYMDCMVEFKVESASGYTGTFPSPVRILWKRGSL